MQDAVGPVECQTKGRLEYSSGPEGCQAATYFRSFRATCFDFVSAVRALLTDISPALLPFSPIFSRISPRETPLLLVMSLSSSSRLELARPPVRRPPPLRACLPSNTSNFVSMTSSSSIWAWIACCWDSSSWRCARSVSRCFVMKASVSAITLVCMFALRNLYEGLYSCFPFLQSVTHLRHVGGT